MKKIQQYDNGNVSFEKASQLRRSCREFSSIKIRMKSLSNILNSATCGDLKDMEIYLTVRRVEGMEKGLYRFGSEEKSIYFIDGGTEYQKKLYEHGLEQGSIYNASVVLVVCGKMEEEDFKMHVAVGKITQLLCLQVAAEGLGCVVVGAFKDSKIKKTLNLRGKLTPLIMLPIGCKDD